MHERRGLSKLEMLPKHAKIFFFSFGFWKGPDKDLIVNDYRSDALGGREGTRTIIHVRCLGQLAVLKGAQEHHHLTCALDSSFGHNRNGTICPEESREKQHVDYLYLWRGGTSEEYQEPVVLDCIQTASRQGPCPRGHMDFQCLQKRCIPK